MTPEMQGLRELADVELDQVCGGKGIVTDTTIVKVPGPTDNIVTTATNGGGNHPPGQQSVVTVPNRLA